ncbi:MULTISPECIES: phosphatase PAP2 family protein [Acinetobacter]|uniref:phosphatase PAP2 family protein n=1 Tax=Acinetobacter TaxID=469 RepID=UPI000558F075|nr:MULTISPECIES: phosphatase PAP2 family protein [Acinetobacter]MBJ8425793.1 phosphatase PAP2 family protein [Acinetobacter bereziniae]MBJ8474591.1 phosphatase PAP2 family protein [Acinetobacter bereziniae]
MPFLESHKFFLKNSLLLGILFLILLFMFPVGGAIDMQLIYPWIDSAGNFPLKNNWFLVEINHKLIKHLVIGFFVIILLSWIASFKFDQLKAFKWQLGYLFWVSVLSTVLIGLLKSHSAHACPWSMTESTAFGYVWDFSATQGHCFPGGHASTGFSLLTGFFVFRKSNPKIAYFFLCLGLVLGFITGWGQMMRGAHFLSHNLWTGWIIYTFNLLVYRIFYNKFRTAIQ